MSSIYTEKYVLFLDILGFEAMINNKEDGYKESEEFARKVLPLLNILTRYVQQKQYWEQHTLFLFIDNNEISQFSDTFVISSNNLQFIINTASHIQTKLLRKGYLSRGAITYGKVFHNGSQFIGPAITRAYNLEKSETLYPRVIIDPECEEKIANMFQGEYKKALKDFDGYYYINIHKSNGFANIEKLYEKYKNTPHRGKYTWLKNKADEVKEVRRKLEDLKYKHKDTYDLPFQDEIF